MKTKLMLACAVSCLAAFSVRAVVPGTVANVTLALTANTTQELTNTNDLYSSTTQVMKYGNAQLLQDLFDEGALTGATSIKGWKVVVVNTTALASDNNPTFILYAVNGTNIVQIDPSRFAFVAGAGSGAETTKTVFNGDGVTVVSSTTKFTSTVFITGSQPSGGDTLAINLQGIASGSSKVSTATVKDANGGASETDTYNLIGAVKVAYISGDVVDQTDTNAYPNVVQGTMNFSASVATDIANYP